MPFNLLLLPLLAGYLYLSRSNMRRYSTALLEKEHLLLAAATFGLIFLLVSRGIIALILTTSVGQHLGALLHHFAPFPYVGTSLGTVLVAVVAWNISNFLVPENVAGLWLYNSKKFDQFTRIFWRAAMGVTPREVPGPMVFTYQSGSALFKDFLSQLRVGLRRNPQVFMANIRRVCVRRYLRSRQRLPQLLGLPFGHAEPLMISLADSKVITGYVDDMPATAAISDHVTIVPLWTGYLHKESRRLYRTTDYTAAYLRVPGQAADLARVIRLGDIVSATIFREAAFDIEDDQDANGQ